MPGEFEVLVRPSVSPDIRPPWRPVVLPDGSQVSAGIGGMDGQLIELTLSESASWSKSREVENERTVDVERVYQKEKTSSGGEEINKENYVDIERLKKIQMMDMVTGETKKMQFTNPDPDDPNRDNIEILEKDVTIKNEAEAGGGSAAP